MQRGSGMEKLPSDRHLPPGRYITKEITARQEAERLWKNDPEGFRRQYGKKAIE